jgi:hypothetical protein
LASAGSLGLNKLKEIKMKITKQKLVEIIKEELEAVLDESKSPMPLDGLTDAEWEFWKSDFKEAVDAGADVDEASAHADEELEKRRGGYYSEPLPAGDVDAPSF